MTRPPPPPRSLAVPLPAGLAAAADVFGVTVGGILGHAMCTGGAAALARRRAAHQGRFWSAPCAPLRAMLHDAPARAGRPARAPAVAGAAVLGGKHLAEHIDERKVAYL